jgi:hypothetical protein
LRFVGARLYCECLNHSDEKRFRCWKFSSGTSRARTDCTVNKGLDTKIDLPRSLPREGGSLRRKHSTLSSPRFSLNRCESTVTGQKQGRGVYKLALRCPLGKFHSTDHRGRCSLMAEYAALTA